MQINRTTNTIKNTATGLIFKILNLLMPFVIRTLIINKLGMEYAGLSSLFTSVLQLLSLSELGFASVVAFEMYKPIAENDRDKICTLITFMRKVYYVIGSALLVVGLAITPALPYFIKGEHPADVNLYVLYFIYLFNTVISYFCFAYKGVLLSAHQRNDVENNVMTLCNMIMYVCQIVALCVFPNYYVYIIFLPLSTLMINLLRARIVNKMFPAYREKREIAAEDKKKIFRNIGAMVGHSMSGVLVVALINVIISANLGLNALAIYNNYYYIASALMGIVRIFYISLMGGIGNSMVVESRDKNYRIFRVLNFINVWLVGWMSVCLLCLFQPFMGIWVGSENMLPDLSAFLFVLLVYFWKFKDMVYTFKDAAGMWRADFWKPYVVTAVTFIAAMILIKLLGIDGVIIAMLLGVFVVSMPWETHVLFKDYFAKSPKRFYLSMLVYTLAIFTVGVLTYYVCSFLPKSGYVGLLLKFAVCLVLPNLIFVALSFRTEEFKSVCDKLKSMLKNRKKKPEQDNPND